MSVYIIAILGSAVWSSVSNQERLGVLAAPREVRSTFLIARLRSAGGFNLWRGFVSHVREKFHFAHSSHDWNHENSASEIKKIIRYRKHISIWYSPRISAFLWQFRYRGQLSIWCSPRISASLRRLGTGSRFPSTVLHISGRDMENKYQKIHLRT